MDDFGMFPGGKLQFESHLERLKEPARTIMSDMRKFAFSLGGNVTEEVRPHRVTYSKTMNFRTFLDVEPAVDSLVVTIKAGRAAASSTLTIKTAQDFENAKKQIAEAYEKIK